MQQAQLRGIGGQGPSTMRHGHIGARERVFLHQFGRGVAAALIGDAQVGPQQVGAVQQQAGLVQRAGKGVVPGREWSRWVA